MNWTAIVTFLAIITGAVFLWSWISKKEANPTTQEAFSLDREIITDLPVGGIDRDTGLIPVANEIPATDPQESLTSDTIYNIVVEAPEIPALDTGAIIDDIIEDIDISTFDPITQPTGGATKPAPKPTTRTFTAITSIEEPKIAFSPVTGKQVETTPTLISMHGEQYVSPTGGILRISGR